MIATQIGLNLVVREDYRRAKGCERNTVLFCHHLLAWEKVTVTDNARFDLFLQIISDLYVSQSWAIRFCS
jgi:hypothetical protein